ncbi:heat shock 70 kDa protein 15-like protein [Tanacetum coccineum]
MSVVGFDLGNESCVVAVARQRGIDRFLGQLVLQLICRTQECISQIKRVDLVRPFSDPELQQVMGMIFSNYEDYSEKNLNTAVVDFAMVCFADFKKGQLRCWLAFRFDQNARACLRLRAACEKLKKVLSANPEAPMNIECLMEDKDVRGFIKRDEFEQISARALDKFVKKPWEMAIDEDSNSQLVIIYAVVVVVQVLSAGCHKVLARILGQGAKANNERKSGTFSVDLEYADENELQAPLTISTYTIGPFQATNAERGKVKVKARLNLHGIVSVDSAQLIEEEEVEVPVTKEPSKEATKMDTDNASADVPSTNETDVNMDDAPVTENGAVDTGDNAVKMETDTKVEAPKEKVKKSNIPVSEVVYGAMLPADVQQAVEKEFEMALQDCVMEETKDKKNAVEAYVSDMSNKSMEMVIESEDTTSSNVGLFDILPEEITERIFRSLRLLQLAQMRSISKRVNGIISSEVFQNVFNGRIDSLSDIIFFAHGRHVNQVEPFGALWGVRGVMGSREITIPLQPIMRNHVYEGEDIQLLASYGIVFLFKVSSKDTKCIRLLLVNILSSTTTPIPKPDELHFQHAFDVSMVPYSSNSSVGFRILYVQLSPTNQPLFSVFTSRSHDWEIVSLSASLVPTNQPFHKNDGRALTFMLNQDFISILSFQPDLVYQNRDPIEIFRNILESYPLPNPFLGFELVCPLYSPLISGGLAALLSTSASTAQGREHFSHLQMLMLTRINQELNEYQFVGSLPENFMSNYDDITYIHDVQVQQTLHYVNIGMVIYTERNRSSSSCRPAHQKSAQKWAKV